MSGRIRVAVVGGGIAGLSAAHALAADPAYEVTVLEASDRVGGKLRLAEVAGVTVDVGAETMLNRRPEAVGLALSLGLDVVHPDATASRLWTRGALRPLPRSVMGVPTDLAQLAASGVLSEEGLERVRREPSLPPTTLDGDVSVADLIGSRLGPEVVDRLVEPLLGGVYAGHATELSARAALPQVVAMLERGSLLEAARDLPTSEVPVFAGIPGGMGTLPARLAEGLDVRTGVTVRGMVPTGSTSDGRFELVLGSAAAPERMVVDRVVVATPAAPAARLLADLAPVAASALGEIEYASMAIVTLALPTVDVDEAPEVSTEGTTGFLVPPVDGRRVKAATFSFEKWGWVREAGRAGGVVVLRASLGRHREEAVLQVPDEELVAAALADLRDAIGPFPGPEDWHVQRWGGGLPQYAVGHLERVRRIRDAVAEVPGLAVCGAAYDGIGIPATIASAQAAVARIRQGA